MSENNQFNVCCAHRALVHVTRRSTHGTQAEHWECADCAVRFVPQHPPRGNSIPGNDYIGASKP